MYSSSKCGVELYVVLILRYMVFLSCCDVHLIQIDILTTITFLGTLYFVILF